jgi:UDP-N-acetylglucosamine 2-epimerase
MVERSSHVLDSLGVEPGSYLLVTVHRASNTDDAENLSNILQALNETEETVIFPAHPRTRQAIEPTGCSPSPRVRLVDPVSYLEMLVLEKNARLVLTDSGGVQKEAYFFGVPCVTLREETEWVETVEAGWNTLVGADKTRILQGVRTFRPEDQQPQVFGDGKASEKIVRHLQSVLPS